MESAGEKKSVIWASAEDGGDFQKILQSSSATSSLVLYCSRYIGPFTLEYNDFDVASSDYSIFYKVIYFFSLILLIISIFFFFFLTQAQYNWDNDGYALVHQVLDGLAPLLGSELQHIRSLTYNRFGDAEGNIDTSAFRDAVWHYTHRIKGKTKTRRKKRKKRRKSCLLTFVFTSGLLDDDYNYAEVNQLLTRQIKYYIKKITCFPQTVTMADFLHLGLDLLPSEKCHIALLATEASKEASMSYALKALSLYLKK
jgi:hypothetical protein